MLCPAALTSRNVSPWVAAGRQSAPTAASEGPGLGLADVGAPGAGPVGASAHPVTSTPPSASTAAKRREVTKRGMRKLPGNVGGTRRRLAARPPGVPPHGRCGGWVGSKTVSTLAWSDLDRRAVDTIRVLAMDAVEKAGNGHPGTAMSLAPAAYLLFQRVLRHDPTDPHWPGRDRFVLSCGHSSLTLYIQDRKSVV